MNGNKFDAWSILQVNDRFWAWSWAVGSARSLSPVTTPKTGR